MDTMQYISQKIYDYYTTNFDALPFEKQFHFASRLNLWDQDSFAGAQIERLKQEFTAGELPKDALRQVYQKGLESPVHGSNNAAELRRPYFERYPTLKTSVLLLFRTTFLQHIYGYDARGELFKLVDQAAFEELAAKLLEDKEAQAILSTHAINFLYLYSRVIREDESFFNPEKFLAVSKQSYDFTNPIHLQLCIYLYTHCIIGEAKFYYRAVPDLHRRTYLYMAAEMERILDAHFTDVNMDNKFEYLVCCKILGITSKHESEIFDEASRSFSDEGDFIIDLHNNNPQTANIDLQKSEHRNVLAIMAGRDFTPIGS